MLLSLISTLDGVGETIIFTRFYQKSKEKLFRYAYSLLSSYDLAEEALQEAWLRCIQKSDVFFSIEPSQRIAWMSVVVKNCSFDLLRKESRHKTLPIDWDFPAPVPGDSTGIVEIIRAMPEQYRILFELKYVVGLTNQEIAKRTGLTITAVSTRLSRGRVLLRKQLIEEGYLEK